MKKTILSVFTIVLLLNVQAQKIGLRGGLNITTQMWKQSDVTIYHKSVTGVHFGCFAEAPITEKLVFQPNLVFNQKGFIITKGVSGYDQEVTVTLNYFDVPLLLMLKGDLAPKVKVFLDGGFSLGYAISGKFKAGSQSEDVKFGSDKDFNQIDTGLIIGGGIEAGTIQISMNYNMGLANISTASDVTQKNRMISISLALLLGK